MKIAFGQMSKKFASVLIYHYSDMGSYRYL